MRKGDIIENILVETMAAEGKCVSHIDGKVIFLQGGAPGDTVDAQVTKIKSSFLEARVTAIKKFSESRATPFCIHFGTCGGCSWQHIQYETQLQYKRQQVIDNLERIGGLELPTINPIVASDRVRFYRNKLDYTFSSQRWLTREELHDENNPGQGEVALGYHIPKKFDLVFDVKECHLQPEPSNAIRLAVRDEAVKESIPLLRSSTTNWISPNDHHPNRHYWRHHGDPASNI